MILKGHACWCQPSSLRLGLVLRPANTELLLLVQLRRFELRLEQMRRLHIMIQLLRRFHKVNEVFFVFVLLGQMAVREVISPRDSFFPLGF